MVEGSGGLNEEGDLETVDGAEDYPVGTAG